MGQDGDAKSLRDSFSLHFAVFMNDVAGLESRLNVSVEDINKVDIHGRTPIMLATVLGHLECAELLLKHGADANTQNKEMWSLSHEAVSLGDPLFLKRVLNYRDFQRAKETLIILRHLRSCLMDTADFYVEMSWEFNSWLPFVRNLCPSDTYKIYKSGSNIRIDTTLLEFENGQRGNQSFILRFTDEKAEIIFVDYTRESAHVQTIDLNDQPTLEDFEPSDDLIVDKLVSPITTTYVDVDNIGFERSKFGVFSWIGSSAKDEEIEGFTCRAYNTSNVEVVTKTRIDHLKEEDKEKYHESENKSMSFLMSLFEKKKSSSSNQKESAVYSSSGNPNSDIYGGLTAEQYLDNLSIENGKRIGKYIPDVVRCNSFNASLWLADSFPLDLKGQIFPIIDLMSVRNAKFSRLKSFIQLQLPSGFPIRICIPLFHMINAQITFKNVNDPSPNERKIEDAAVDELGLPIFQLKPFLFDIPSGFSVYTTNASLLFDNVVHKSTKPSTTAGTIQYNSVDIDNDYVYLLERFMNDDEDLPESSSYRQQMQFAIEESIALSKNRSSQETGVQDTSVSNSTVDAHVYDELFDAASNDEELTQAIKMSQEENDIRRQQEVLEEEELRRVLELSKLET